MLVTPKKGTACLNVNARSGCDGHSQGFIPQRSLLVPNYKPLSLSDCSKASQNQAGLCRLRDGERRAVSPVTNLGAVPSKPASVASFRRELKTYAASHEPHVE
jgi:hypothetical protein